MSLSAIEKPRRSRPIAAPGGRAPTINDVASAVGVGKATVSLVLNRKGNISPAMRRAVLRAAKEMGYRPNSHAQRLARGGCDNTVGIFVPRLYDGIGTTRVQHIQHLLGAEGYDVPIYTYGSASGSHARLIDSAVREKPRAIVCQVDADQADVLEVLGNYRAEGGVVVCYGDPLPLECDQVLYDFFGAAYKAVEHLVEFGHHQIGLYCPASPGNPYALGYRQALADAGIEPRNEWMFDGPAFEAGGMRLAEYFRALTERPSAMCVVNDVSASAFINQMVRSGRHIPQELSVVGFDDTAGAAAAIVPITTMRQPVEDIAQHVMNLLNQQLDAAPRAAQAPVRILVESELIVRDSTWPYHSKRSPE